MSLRFMPFTLAVFSLSLVLSTFSVPTSLEVESKGVSPLSRRITHAGRGTFFYPGEGNCGEWNDSNDPIVAISIQIYGDGANCNQWVKITNTQNGNEAYGMVRDSCPSCSAGSLDMSPALFEQLAPLSEGVISVLWHYMPRDFSP